MFLNIDQMHREKILEEIAALPQVKSDAVKKPDIMKWLDQVARIDPQRISWHVRRLGGIGGSEIASVMGLKGAYATPEMIAKQKLMIIPPFRPTAAMQRGAVAEPYIRELFEGAADTGTAVEMSENLRSNALRAVIQDLFGTEMDRRFGAGTWKARPDLEELVQRPKKRVGGLPEWVIGSPDRIYEINNGFQTFIVVVDFKAPAEKTMDEIRSNPAKLLPWRAQVQQYGAILADHGHPPARLVLAVFNYANVGTSTFYIDETVPAPDVCQLMLDAGTNFWERHVLTGNVPVAQVSPKVAKAPADIEEAAVRSVYLAAFRDAAKDELEKMQRPIRDWINEDPETRGHLGIGTVDGAQMWLPRSKTNFDAEAAIFRLVDVGHVSLEQSLALRGPAEALPPSDPRFGSSLAVAKTKLRELEDAIGQLRPGQTLDADQLALLRQMAGQAASLTAPVRPGPPNPDLVRTALADAKEPLAPFLTTEITIARNGTRVGKEIFHKISADAQDQINASAQQMRPQPDVEVQQKVAPQLVLPASLTSGPS
jgi:hypothetical protein